MTYSEFKERAKQFFREQLSVTDYIDVLAASANIRSNIPFRGPNIYILFVAIVIASVGLNVNSIPVIIGAMLISPLMSPIIGFGMGLGTNDTDLLLQSLKNLGIMFAISLLASTLYFMVTPLETDNPTELLARTNPSVYDVLIAFFGGIAGILELSRKEKGTVLPAWLSLPHSCRRSVRSVTVSPASTGNTQQERSICSSSTVSSSPWLLSWRSNTCVFLWRKRKTEPRAGESSPMVC